MRAEIRKLSPMHIDAGRHGQSYAKKKYAYLQGKHRPEWPLQVVEIDECKVSLQTIFQGDPVWQRKDNTARKELEEEVGCLQLSAAIDVRMKCILAMQLARTATTDLAISTLKMARSDKNDLAKAAGCEIPRDMASRIQTA